VKGLAWVTLARHRHELSQNDSVVVESRIMGLADQLTATRPALARRVDPGWPRCVRFRP